MCGIAGWYVRKGVEWRPSLDVIKALYEGIEQRGTDATGYGSWNEDSKEFWVLKGPINYRQFWPTLKSWADKPEDGLPISRIGLLHVRAATVGDESDNNNNHPLAYEHNDTAVLVTHNGTVGNLEKCYEKLGIKPIAEVDSALIPAALAIKGPVEGLKFLKENSCGQATFAAVFDDGRFLLARETRPLFIGSPAPGVILWASEEAPLKRFCTHYEMGLEFNHISSAADMKYALWHPDSDKPQVGEFRLPFMNTTGSGKKGGPSGNTFPKSDGVHGEGQKGHGHAGDNSRVTSGLVESRESLQRHPVLGDVRHPICMWKGCWSPATDRVFLKREEAWAPACAPHTKKVKNKREFDMSKDHERRRKIEKMKAGG